MNSTLQNSLPARLIAACCSVEAVGAFGAGLMTAACCFALSASLAFAEGELADTKGSFFEQERVNEDFFKNAPPPEFSGPLDRSKLVPPPLPEPVPVQKQAGQTGNADQHDAQEEGLTDYSNRQPGPEDAEGINLKNEILKRARQDSGMNEVFERARLIKEQVGVQSPDEDYDEKLEQIQSGVPGQPSKKKTDSNRF